MPEVIDRGWEHQKAISPLPLGGFRDPGGLARSVLVDAANDGHGLRHLVQRHLEDTLLLFEGQRRNLRSVGVGGDAGHPWRVDQVPQMPAVVLLVDLQLGIESHQIGWYDSPENQLRSHRKTSPRSALAAPITLASRPGSFTETFVSLHIRERCARAIRIGTYANRPFTLAKPKGADKLKYPMCKLLVG